MFCNVSEKDVITALDVRNIYEVPLVYHSEGLDDTIVSHLCLPDQAPDLSRWEKMIECDRNPIDTVRIGIVGKYVEYEDSYKSLNEALYHGGLANQLRVELKWVESEGLLDEMLDEQLGKYDAILVPGGFGKRGVAGMMLAPMYARIGRFRFLAFVLEWNVP